MFQAGDEGTFQCAFVCRFIERRRFEDVRVFQKFLGQVGLRRRQREGKVRRSLADAFVKLRVEMVNEHAARPALSYCLTDVELPCFRVLHTVEEDAIVLPRNLCTKLVHN